MPSSLLHPGVADPRRPRRSEDHLEDLLFCATKLGQLTSQSAYPLPVSTSPPSLLNLARSKLWRLLLISPKKNSTHSLQTVAAGYSVVPSLSSNPTPLHVHAVVIFSSSPTPARPTVLRGSRSCPPVASIRRRRQGPGTSKQVSTRDQSRGDREFVTSIR